MNTCDIAHGIMHMLMMGKVKGAISPIFYKPLKLTTAGLFLVDDQHERTGYLLAIFIPKSDTSKEDILMQESPGVFLDDQGTKHYLEDLMGGHNGVEAGAHG